MKTLTVILFAALASGCALDSTEESQSDGVEFGGGVIEEGSAAQVTSLGSFPGAVHGMALGEGGRLFFSDSFGALSATRSLYFLDAPYTGPIRRTHISGSLPAGLMWDGSSLFICDVGASSVSQIDRRGRIVAQWAATAPWNVTRMPSGELLTVSNNGMVQRLEPNGAVTTLFAGLDAPFDLAPGPNGTLWVSEQGAVGAGRVARRTLDGTIVEIIDYPWDNPEGLWSDESGTLWIAETSLGQILSYDASGLTLAAEGIGLPVIITGDGTGTLLVNSVNSPAQLLSVSTGK